ncbi:MAG TPA: DUF1972 domain-containing protein [Acidobacteriota bacterium]|nr:DUF1972 domain-containing protein [Acidobacteriota bacterium]
MKLEIAILGTRGIPANYGGFETFAEELSVRLVERGHSVTVYGRSHYLPPGVEQYRGVQVRRLASIRQKYLETVSHTAFSILDASWRGYDVVLICNAANALFCPIPRICGAKVVLNVDGIERLRRKWNALGRGFYLLSERLSTWFPDAVVTDARSVQEYYLKRYHLESTFIPYGAPVECVKTRTILEKLNLPYKGYILYVSRLEPENNADRVLEAYLRSNLEIPLAMIGDAPYNRGFIRDLREKAKGRKVVMPGAIYGKGYHELLAGALCYLQATEVGGTHPALVEAMGAGCVVISHDTVENREVLADAGILVNFHDIEGLAATLSTVCRAWDEFKDLGERARERVRRHYDWEAVVDQYEQLFWDLLGDTVKLTTPS